MPDMTLAQALEWADKTLNQRLREARRTGNDHDYDATMEACIDTLAAEIRRRDGETCDECRRWTQYRDPNYGDCAHWGSATPRKHGCRAWQQREGE